MDRRLCALVRSRYRGPSSEHDRFRAMGRERVRMVGWLGHRRQDRRQWFCSTFRPWRCLAVRGPDRSRCGLDGGNDQRIDRLRRRLGATPNRELRVPDDYDVEAMIAVGRPGDPNDLPEKMRELDLQPSGRNPIHAFAAEGTFAFA